MVSKKFNSVLTHAAIYVLYKTVAFVKTLTHATQMPLNALLSILIKLLVKIVGTSNCSMPESIQWFSNTKHEMLDTTCKNMNRHDTLNNG